ncbi:MAG TPA: GNAT family N-acetyltransferase [Streptomyces sp.]|uniref:GNAT family N-acetyltransferase n=1 Tax=Streptomyces sp. TaxID=1931 RepID=UPI002D628648|nr:GNAT family N-acetyltransferase [Streptomyces sp.]HZG06574.1 GNAT family N-acetyltransferase [Streptomyces sp.]
MTGRDGGALAEILADAARGVFPAPDGSVTVVPQPSARDAGVLALAAHSVVFTDEDPAWVRERIGRAPGDALGAALSPSFLTDLTARTGRVAGTVDLLSVAAPLPGPPPLPLTGLDDPGHPRVARALLFRDEVRVWEADGGVVVLGRGVAGRWEVAVEVDGRARGKGLGRALALSARHLVPAGAPLWAQQAPGNAPSVRAFQAAGYRPVGAEVLLAARERARGRTD